jgi:hypothetical protein
MNTTTPVVTAAVDRLNEQRNEQIIQEGLRLTECINKEQAKIKACEDNIARNRVEINAVANRVVTAVSVLGNAIPDNANKDTLSAVIEKANKAKQYGIEQESDRLQKAIVADQDAVILINKRIEELRAALLALKVEVVTVEQIVG